MCNECNNQESKCSCKEVKVVQQFTDNVFLNSCNVNDKLQNLKLPLGTDLTTILKKIDFKFGDNANTVNFSAFNLVYLFSNYTITNIKQFTEAVSIEFGSNKALINALKVGTTTQQIQLTNNYNAIQQIKVPSVIDSSGVGFTVNDSINVILQKIVDKFNTLTASSGIVNITTDNTDSLLLSLIPNQTGKKLKGDVRLSAISNNAITKQPDGLYVSKVASGNAIAQLELVTGNKIGIVGSNSVEIPTQSSQSLSITGNQLTISNGNSVPLPSLNESPLVTNNSGSIRITQAIGNNHNITANAIISADNLNRLSITNDGLLVIMNANDVLNQISGSNVLKEAFALLVSAALKTPCFRWAIENKGTVAATINYLDLNEIAQTATVGVNTTFDLGASRLLTVSTSTLIITFQGKC